MIVIKAKPANRRAFIIASGLIVPNNAFKCLHATIILIVDKDMLPPRPTEGEGNPHGVPTRSVFQELRVEFFCGLPFIDWKFLDVVLVVIQNRFIGFLSAFAQELPTYQRIRTRLWRVATDSEESQKGSCDYDAAAR